MTDALTEFCMTGKMNVKDLFKTIIQQIVMTQAKAATSGLVNLILGFTGTGNGYSTGSAQGDIYAGFSGMKSAQGTAWANGVQMFAKGGTFSNSVVSSPTLFKFAKGTGMMGEAGPEAIMPLTRDGQGNLGVRASGSSQGSVQNNVSVNVSVSGGNATAQVNSEQGGKALGEAISAAVKAELVRQTRSGGILDKSRRAA